MTNATKTIVITGASSGVGAAAARQLAERGHTVAVVGRNPERTKKVAESIGAQHFIADYDELAQVRRLAEELQEAFPAIDVLFNNAGGAFAQRNLTVDAYERTFQVNHLAPFLLTNLLAEQLGAGEGRVIGTSSIAAMIGAVDLTDLMHVEDYKYMKVYGDAKMATIMFSKEINRRLSSQGLFGVSFHPGVVATSFGDKLPGPFGGLYKNAVTSAFMDSSETAAERMVFLAEGTLGKDVVPGEFYVRNRPFFVPARGKDREVAADLWEESARMVGL